jgi:3-hydroxyisobutyrate dehydrogenase
MTVLVPACDLPTAKDSKWPAASSLSKFRIRAVVAGATQSIMIAFLGMGLLGSNFVRALLARGEQVQVWNRSATKAQALQSVGAVVCADPASAVRGCERVHLTLSDDAAVDDVLEQARPGFAKNVVIVDHTTTSPTGTRARALRWAERGVAFQHAPVFMGPKNALEASGVMLASGERARFEALEPALSKMTGKLLHLGDEPDRAAAFKLLGNAFLMFMTAGLTDFFALAKGMNIPAKEASSLFGFFNPGLTLPSRVDRMLASDYANPSWELSMARKDARLMLEAADQGNQPLAFLPVIAQVMDAFIERGHGHDDWTVIAKDVV